MYHDLLLQKTVVANSNLHHGNLSEARNEQTTHELSIPDIAISLSPVGFLIGWIVFFLILQKIRAFLDEKMVISINGLHKLPCKNCRFYSNNHYLKCAVNPSIVLTEEAINCSEYSPNNKKSSSKNPFD
ncbi:MAG: hypothetical protein HWQ35_16780 [Nostoc sp. NMS1]|uniref:hypothetical protein n=1 Tax=unclassified Nostoc TaxID=2593658 RepID=UPI0025E8C8C3|nr:MULTISPECIES: hypothetical protein [unclassified Nostoc]MBN3908135.1 hypothetical protein [Nostoc sp. NMS1]MBN3992137.1 hypothetical protein [Nostoc sp. NMS2]